VKTTLEIPDDLLDRAKAKAAERGIPLRQFVVEAVEDKVNASDEQKPWMQAFGKLRHLHDETVRIDRLIEAEFEQIEPEEWT
jgi:hypothetical protein